MDKFIDMHCHILPGVDDGAKDIQEMKRMLNIAYNEGICCMIATPHHHPRRGREKPEVLKEKLVLARSEAKKINEKFRIYLGTEVYFGQDVPEMLKDRKILTMNSREYVLVEFSPSDSYMYIQQSIQQLQMKGFEVILAHIERYNCILDEIELAEHLHNMGTLIQINAGSITGDSGRKVKKFVKQLMEYNLVFCVGTDAHSERHRPPKMRKAAEYVEKKFGEDYARRIFFSNAMRMLKKQKKHESR